MLDAPEPLVDAKPSVLLVDDVEANLIAGEALLEGLECTVVRARSGNEALRLLLKQEFAVVLLDVQMPAMDGYEVAEFARGNPATRAVPIIFLTATQNTDATMFRAYGTGAVDFLTKPANAHVLRAKVQVFLDLYVSRRQLAEEVQSHKVTLAALEGANAALRHFTYAASHDLRAPLRAVRGLLEVLEEGKEQLSPAVRETLGRMAAANDRMDSLLNSLLAYARLRKPVSFGAVDCAAIMKRVETDLAGVLGASKAQLRVVQLPIISGDADRVYQLFLNLVSNATKFRKSPSHVPGITVSADERSGEWVFCVEDDGIGIAVEHQKTVFEPFERLHSQSAYDGSGLGLTLCREIVEQHGGRIWLESEPEKGCRFYFTLAPARGAT